MCPGEPNFGHASGSPVCVDESRSSSRVRRLINPPNLGRPSERADGGRPDSDPGIHVAAIEIRERGMGAKSGPPRNPSGGVSQNSSPPGFLTSPEKATNLALG